VFHPLFPFLEVWPPLFCSAFFQVSTSYIHTYMFHFIFFSFCLYQCRLLRPAAKLANHNKCSGSGSVGKLLSLPDPLLFVRIRILPSNKQKIKENKCSGSVTF
jgi:hypothetical protein